VLIVPSPCAVARAAELAAIAPPYRWVIEEPGGCGADTDHQPERADWSKCELAFDIADVVEVERQSQQGDTIIARQHH
jgi:hypothetical protein